MSFAITSCIFDKDCFPAVFKSCLHGGIPVFLIKKFLALKGHILPSLVVLRHVKPLPGNILPHAKIRRMLSSMDTSAPDAYRDRTILELLYSTAIRAGVL